MWGIVIFLCNIPNVNRIFSICPFSSKGANMNFLSLVVVVVVVLVVIEINLVMSGAIRFCTHK